ncbi:MAG: ArnT family glycosyltransferase [Candidatus Sumerlaeia bacterium]
MAAPDISPDSPDRVFVPLAIVLLFLFLTLPFLGRMGAGHDEVVDITIADYFSTDWLVGSNGDPSQMRLPMYLSWVAFRLFSVDSSEGRLLVARGMTLLMACFILVGIYALARTHFDKWTALASSLILALNPFLLFYGRCAMTESGVYFTAGIVWLLWAASRYMREPTTGRFALLAFLWGIAVAFKFTSILLFPALFLLLLIPFRRKDDDSQREAPSLLRQLLLALLVLVLGGIVLGPWIVAIRQYAQDPGFSPGGWKQDLAIEFWRFADFYHAFLSQRFRMFQYVALLLTGMAIVAWCWWNRPKRIGIIPGLFLLAGLSMWAFYAFAPSHLANAHIPLNLVARLAHSSQPITGGRWNTFGYYMLLLISKPTFVIGALTIAGFLISLVVLKPRRGNIFPALIVLLLLASLLIIDAKQVFYVLPIFVVMLPWAVHFFMSLRRIHWIIPAIIGALCLIQIMAAHIRSYPDSQFNGYQYFGNRIILNHPAISYFGLVTSTSDGLEQAVNWLERNAKPGEKVVFYYVFNPAHVVEYFAPHAPYQWSFGNSSADRSIDRQADYIVMSLELNKLAELYGKTPKPLGWKTPDMEWLEKECVPLLRVRRRFDLDSVILWHNPNPE